MIFDNRQDAGKRLATELLKKNYSNPLIIALPKGGLVVGSEVSKVLKAPLDVIITRKIGAPFNAELAVGAIAEGEPIYKYRNEELIKALKVQESYIESEIDQQTEELKTRQQLYRKGARKSLEGKTVILTDDGVATGATILAALQALKKAGAAKLVLAVPVCPADKFPELKGHADEIVALLAPEDFQAVGQFYRDFRQLTEDEIKPYLI